MSDLPPGWEWAVLGDIAESVKNGIYVSRPGATPDGVPILRINAVRPAELRVDEIRYSGKSIEELQSEGALLEPGDLLFTRYSGSRDYVGVCAVTPDNVGPLTYPDKLIRVRLKEVEPKYVMFAFSSPPIRSIVESSLRTTAGQVGISGANLKAVRIPLAPLAEQRRIVAALEQHLSCMDDGTRMTEHSFSWQQRLESVLLEHAVTGKLSNSMTTDGSASELVAQSRDRVSVCHKPRSATARRLPHAALLALGKATLPISWTWAEWGQLGLSQNGVSFPSSSYQQSGVRLIRPGNLTASGFISWTPDNTRKLPESYARKHPSLMIPADSLIMNLTAQSLKDNFLGRTCIKLDQEPALLNQRLAWLKPAMMNSRYVWLVFRSPLFRNFVDQLGSGSLIQHINTWQIEKFMVPVPPLEEQIRIIGRYEELSSKIRKGGEFACALINRINILRNGILADAFNGRLVSQDSSDEPAAVLLDRIKAERVPPPKFNRDRRKAARTNPGQESMP